MLASRMASDYDSRMRYVDAGQLPKPTRSGRCALAVALAVMGIAGCAKAPIHGKAATAQATHATPAAVEGTEATPPAPVAVAATTHPVTHRVAVDRIDSSRVVQVQGRERCGERITTTLTPPSAFGRMASWVGLGGPSEGEVPAPDFRTEVQCTHGAERNYAPAQYRVEFRDGNESFLVNVGQRPGATVEVDDTHRVLGLDATPR